MDDLSLGLFETLGYVPAVAGADAALKAAEVKLLGCRYAGSGLVSVLLSGDVSSVTVAVEVGCECAARVGTVNWSTVIARTAEGLETVVRDNPEESRGKKEADDEQGEKSVIPPRAELEKMRVMDLRSLARNLPDLFLNREEIRFSRKAELISAILKSAVQHKE